MAITFRTSRSCTPGFGPPFVSIPLGNSVPGILVEVQFLCDPTLGHPQLLVCDGCYLGPVLVMVMVMVMVSV